MILMSLLLSSVQRQQEAAQWYTVYSEQCVQASRCSCGNRPCKWQTVRKPCSLTGFIFGRSHGKRVCQLLAFLQKTWNAQH